MILTLQRTHTHGPRTFGELSTDGQFLAFTLEDALREVPDQPVEAWKIKGATAIPSTDFAGRRYRVTLENSPRFGPDTLSVAPVPGFAAIRMHAGNTERDTEGCPLLGLQITEAGIVGGTSRPAVELVKGRVRAALQRGDQVLLDVINPEGQS